MCGSGFSVTRPEHVGRVVALAERGGRVGVLVRHQGEHEHGKREDEVADLGVQDRSCSAGLAGRLHAAAGSSQSRLALDLASGLPLYFPASWARAVPEPRCHSDRGRRAPNQVRQEAHASDQVPAPRSNRTQRSQLRTALKKVRSAAGAEVEAAYAEAREAARPRRPEAPHPSQHRGPAEEPAGEAEAKVG